MKKQKAELRPGIVCTPAAIAALSEKVPDVQKVFNVIMAREDAVHIVKGNLITKF